MSPSRANTNPRSGLRTAPALRTASFFGTSPAHLAFSVLSSARNRSRIGMLLAAAALISCDRATSDGAVDLEALTALSAVLELRLGSVDDAATGFSSVRGVDVDRDGRTYVFEAAEMQIRVYDADGRLLRRIGRRGEGPGEFQRVARFGVVGDTVWTFDYAGDRITLFDREGTLLSTGRAESQGIGLWNQCFGYVVPWAMRADGLISGVFSRVACNRRSPAPEMTAADPVLVPRLLFDATGAIVDTIGLDGAPPPRMARPPDVTAESPLQTLEVDGVPYRIPSPPSQLPHWIWLHDGRIVRVLPTPTSAEAHMTLTRIALSGDTLYHRRYAYEADRYTDSELDALAAEAASRTLFGQGGGPPDPSLQARLRARMTFPEFRQGVETVEVDEDGRIWIRRDEPVRETSRFAVLDADGLPLGELELDGDLRVMWSSADVAWLVETDALGVPWLVRYRIGDL